MLLVQLHHSKEQMLDPDWAYRIDAMNWYASLLNIYLFNTVYVEVSDRIWSTFLLSLSYDSKIF